MPTSMNPLSRSRAHTSSPDVRSSSASSISACRPTVWAPAWCKCAIRRSAAWLNAISSSTTRRFPPSSAPAGSSGPTSPSPDAWTAKTITLASWMLPIAPIPTWSPPPRKRSNGYSTSTWEKSSPLPKSPRHPTRGRRKRPGRMKITGSSSTSSSTRKRRSIVTRRHTYLIVLVVGLLLAGGASFAADASGVKVWETKITIPTYLAGDPEPNPSFFFGRQSQGAQGPVYPYPMYDTLTGKKVDKTYTIVHLENEYLKIGVLPEIGGRIVEGIDKTNNYNFIYRQHVIKPALLRLIRAPVSRGVGRRMPHHHRATTFIPVQYKVEEDTDGS